MAAVPAGFDAEQTAAERALLRATIIGIALGMLGGAGVWILVVVVALVGTDWPLGPVVAMGAGVGMFGGAFFGGWAGTVVGCRRLEEVEHRSLPH